MFSIAAPLFHKAIGHELAVIRRHRRHFALLFQERRSVNNRFAYRPVQLLDLLSRRQIGVAFYQPRHVSFRHAAQT